jgi:5-methyltetrahydropteroyltriglutamate--homocysteine methyltransferase
MARILTTTVGSYPVPDWLSALPSEQAVMDATRVIFDLQRQAGIDLPTDGELYRFDVNHPDTNGMIEYFVSQLGGIDTAVSRTDGIAFRAKHEMAFRRKPAAVVRGPITEGTLNLADDCTRAASVAWLPDGSGFWYTVYPPDDEYHRHVRFHRGEGFLHRSRHGANAHVGLRRDQAAQTFPQQGVVIHQ